jgi:hypothetical protein
MRYSDLKTVMLSQFAMPDGNQVAYFIKGKPGGGKSALARDVVRSFGGTEDNTIEFNGSTRDPVDILGTPNNNGEYTRWVMPEEFYRLRKGVGKCFLILEEMTDMAMPMQNAVCRVILDRHAGNAPLSDQLYIIATGNRTEDKSGANRLSTKLGNRLRQHTFEENLDDWVDWAQGRALDPVLIQFVRFKPKLLSDFDPNRVDGVNPTPRSWESVSRIDTNLRQDLFFQEVSGSVGDGAASEYVNFRKVYMSLIPFEAVVADPSGVKVPKELSALFATVGSCAHNVTAQNIAPVATFIDRLPQDFSTMFWLDARKTKPELRTTKAFISWATKNANVILN